MLVQQMFREGTYSNYTYAGPSSGWVMDPTNPSWLILKRWAMTLSITTPNADRMVQNQALPADTTGLIVIELYWYG